jgi:hypothetical protein
MFTPTLGEINTAISTNNRKQAITMVQTLIQQKPSADAWFLAAKLTYDRKKKIEYLRTAMFLNPNHQKSKTYLRQLGEGNGGVQHIVAGGVSSYLQDQINQSPLLQKMSPAMRRVLATLIFVLLGIFVGLLVSGLLSLRGPVISSQGPTTEAIEHLTQASVLNHLYLSDLDILFVEQSRNSQIGKDINRIELRDAANRSQFIEVFVYDSVTAILADQAILSTYEQSFNVLANGNVIVTYPLDMSEIGASSIIEAFETLQ